MTVAYGGCLNDIQIFCTNDKETIITLELTFMIEYLILEQGCWNSGKSIKIKSKQWASLIFTQWRAGEARHFPVVENKSMVEKPYWNARHNVIRSDLCYLPLHCSPAVLYLKVANIKPRCRLRMGSDPYESLDHIGSKFASLASANSRELPHV